MRGGRLKEKRLYVLPALLLVFLQADLASAAFEGVPGKRICALGGAAVAGAGDPMGFFYNPASIAWGTQTVFETQYGRLFWGLEGDDLDHSALGGYASLGSWGSVALGYDRFSSGLYSEDRAVVAYGRAFRTNAGAFSAGVGLNLLGRTYEQTEYTAVDPLFRTHGYVKQSLAVDAGIQYRPSNRISVGVAARRINRPNQAIEPGVEDPLPRQVQIGMVFALENVTLFSDLEYRDRELEGVDFTPRVGVEIPLLENRLHVRGGGNRDEAAAGFGLTFYTSDFERKYIRTLSSGERMRLKDTRQLKLRMGYTFRMPIGGITATAGHHLFGLDLFFDRKRQVLETRFVERPKLEPRYIIQHDTVTVKEPEYIQVESVDTAYVRSLERKLSEMEDRDKVITDVNEALRWLEKAQTDYLQKNYRSALRACDKALKIVPTLALAYKRKGSIYYALGQLIAARNEWERCLELDPENKDVKKFLKQLPKNIR